MSQITRELRAASANGQVAWNGGSPTPVTATVDVTRVLVTAELVLGAVAVADRWARRPGSPRADVVMGPGGWVSMKGGTMHVRPRSRLWLRQPPPPPTPRPWWARLLAAKALQTLGR